MPHHLQVTLQGAMGILLVLLSMIRSHPAIETGHAGTFVSPVVHSRDLSKTGFTYRGLAPHKFTPMPGEHLEFDSSSLTSMINDVIMKGD